METEARDAFLHQQEKPRAVTRIEEDVQAAITAKNNVVNSAGIMKSWFTWHTKNRQESPFVTLDPSGLL